MKTKELVLAAFCTALTAVAAQISVPLPFTPVPFAMSVFAVYLAGALLSVREALLSQVAYLLLGAAGVPVFAGFHAGGGVLAGPTGGFLVIYPVMAALIALLCRLFGRKTLPVLSTAMLCALAVCYLGGSLWFCVSSRVSWPKSLLLTVVPFLPLDLVKVAVCANIVRFAAPLCGGRAPQPSPTPGSEKK